MSEITKKVEEINKKVEEINKILREKKNEPGDEASLKKLKDQIGTLVPDEVQDELKLENFFTDVSQSLITAQTELNTRSLEYARSLDGRILPVYYSIPSLKAEMKVGFSQTSGKGVNLILFSKKEERERFGESTVSFELVAVPPTPGMAGSPIPGFLVSGEEKNRLIEKINKQAPEEAKKKNKEELFTRFKHTIDNDLVLVLRDTGVESEKRYLVFWPSQETGDMKKDRWREMLIFTVVEKESSIEIGLDRDVFDEEFAKDQSYLFIPDTDGTEGLKGKSPEDLLGHLVLLGDAVMRSLLIIQKGLQ